MQKSSLKFWLLNGGILFYLLASEPIVAQVVPDATLPNNSVVPPNCTNCEITGGTTVGNNLFHSFQQFSIPTGGTAYFNNTSTIENIITRVTGKSISNIDGLIRANGTANLFLLNPNGIIFGSNASLNIGGSFLASTASSLKFADGTEFSAINPQSQPLLTISVPIGLQFGDSAGRIVNQSQASLGVNSFELPAGLHVQPGRTLALVGGDLVLERGNITAEAGRIELGSVAGNNLVSLTVNERGWVLGYEGIQNFQDISLSQTSFVDTSGDRGGDIQIQGRRVTLTEGSQVFSNSLTAGKAGKLRVSASESVELLGVGSFPDGGFFPTGLFARVEKEATGEGGTLTIETRRLSIRDGGTVSTTTFGAGRGVDLVVKASESVEIEGTSPDGGFPSSLFAGVDFIEPGEEATGRGGTLSIETGRLSVRGGAQVSTITFSSGRAGDLRVNALESVELTGTAPPELTGTAPNQLAPSGLLVNAEFGAKGDAGNLLLETGRLTVLDGAQISSFTRGGGQAGNLDISASDSIQLSGASPFASPTVGRSGIFASAEPGATRKAGELSITARQLTVENGAEISANNFGTGEQGTARFNVRQLIIRNGGEVRANSFSSGKAGNLIVNADEFIVLDNSGILRADTKGGGGNIEVTSPSLIMRRNSSITTNATGTASGGNIKLNTDVLVALENSDINANSEEFQGGKVRIDAQAIFGTEFRPAPIRDTPESDITATGGTPDLSGTVIINTPDVDPSSGLIELPENFVDASSLVDRRCSPSNRASRFVVTGSGGLPSSPIAVLGGDAIDVNWVTLPEQKSDRANITEDNFQVGDRIVEAQGWVKGPNGEVILTANPPTATPHNSWQRPIDCP